MKTYKTYQARNAVKAAQVTNHIKAAKKNGVSHIDAKAEAYRIYNIKAGVPFILQGLKVKAAGLPPLPVVKTVTKKVSLPPLPKVVVSNKRLVQTPFGVMENHSHKNFNYDLEV